MSDGEIKILKKRIDDFQMLKKAARHNTHVLKLGQGRKKSKPVNPTKKTPVF